MHIKVVVLLALYMHLL